MRGQILEGLRTVRTTLPRAECGHDASRRHARAIEVPGKSLVYSGVYDIGSERTPTCIANWFSGSHGIRASRIFSPEIT